MHRVAHVSAGLAVDVAAEVQAGRGREGAERGGQACGRPTAAVADRTRAGAGRVLVVAEQAAGAGRRQVRSGYSRAAAGPGDIAHGRVPQEQSLAQHVGAVRHGPGTGRAPGRGLGQHVVDQVGDRWRHVRWQRGHWGVLVRERDG